MNTFQKLIGFSLLIASLSIAYNYAIRPIQRDIQLEKCIHGAGISYGGDNSFIDRCIEKYGNK